MTTTEVASISHLLDVRPWLGEYADDFDVEAMTADYVAALGAAAGPGVHVTASGLVFADVEEAERARGIDWRELAESIDLSAIAQRHETTNQPA